MAAAIVGAARESEGAGDGRVRSVESDDSAERGRGTRAPEADKPGEPAEKLGERRRPVGEGDGAGLEEGNGEEIVNGVSVRPREGVDGGRFSCGIARAGRGGSSSSANGSKRQVGVVGGSEGRRKRGLGGGPGATKKRGVGTVAAAGRERSRSRPAGNFEFHVADVRRRAREGRG